MRNERTGSAAAAAALPRHRFRSERSPLCASRIPQKPPSVPRSSGNSTQGSLEPRSDLLLESRYFTFIGRTSSCLPRCGSAPSL
jgi:hypothetical protein